MALSTTIASDGDFRAFIAEYFEAWSGTEDLILSCYSDTVSMEIPGTILNGKAALRDQFVRPFLAGFPGNRHVVKNMMFGKDVVVVEWEFRSRYKGPFAGTAATGSAVKLPGCGVLSIRSGEATAHRSPYLLRGHDLTQTDFVTPASSAPELADIVVCRAGLSTAREHVRHSH